jgi:tetratricopeptide (TPR) repeat protein
MSMRKIMLLSVVTLGLAFCATSQKKLAQDDEKNPQYQYEKAVIAMKYGLPDEALKYVEQALSLDPQHYLSLNLLAMLCLQKEDYAGAAAALEKCLTVKPDFPDGHNNLGTAYLKMGIKDKAMAEFQKAFAGNGNAFAAFNMANLSLERKELPVALDWIEKTVQKSPREAGVYNLKGVILNEMGRYPEAVLSLETGLSLAPADVAININLGIAYMNNKQLDRARKIFEKVLPTIKDEALKSRVAEYIKSIKEAGQ